MKIQRQKVKFAVRCLGLSAFFACVQESALYVPFLPLNEGPLSAEAAQTAPSNGQAGLEADRLKIRSRAIEKESLAKATEETVAQLLEDAAWAVQAKRAGIARSYVKDALALDPANARAREIRTHLKEIQEEGAEYSAGITESELPGTSPEERRRIIDALMKRGDKFLAKELYDAAVEQYERIFQLDPLNQKASRRIDEIKKMFIEQKRTEWKKQSAEVRGAMSEKSEYTTQTAKRLIREGKIFEAKVLLNRLALIQPRDKQVRRLMEEVKKQEAALAAKGGSAA